MTTTNSSESIEATVLRTTLVNLPSIQALTAWDGQYKVFWEHVETDVPNPYVVIRHYWGGDEKDNRYSDSHWLIYGHTADMSTARAFTNAIAELKGVWPDTSAYADVCAYAPLKKIAPYFFRYQVQNVPFFRAGAIVRIRLFLGSTI